MADSRKPARQETVEGELEPRRERLGLQQDHPTLHLLRQRPGPCSGRARPSVHEPALDDVDVEGGRPPGIRHRRGPTRNRLRDDPPPSHARRGRGGRPCRGETAGPRRRCTGTRGAPVNLTPIAGLESICLAAKATRASRCARCARGCSTQPREPNGMIAVVMLLWRDTGRIAPSAGGLTFAAGPSSRQRATHRGPRTTSSSAPVAVAHRLTPTPLSAGRSSTTAAPPTSRARTPPWEPPWSPAARTGGSCPTIQRRAATAGGRPTRQGCRGQRASDPIRAASGFRCGHVGAQHAERFRRARIRNSSSRPTSPPDDATPAE